MLKIENDYFIINVVYMLKVPQLDKFGFKSAEILDRSFFTRSDVVLISHELLGKVIITNMKEGLCGGIISEVEAYFGSIDLASHAYKNKVTKRNQSLYCNGGVLYVHTCRGHVMLNIVTNIENIPQGILIRAIVPVLGIDLMKKRRGGFNEKDLANGPGKLTKALGIKIEHNMIRVCKDDGIFEKLPEICIVDAGIKIETNMIKKTPRIGVNYAKAWAKHPLRFIVSDKYFYDKFDELK